MKSPFYKTLMFLFLSLSFLGQATASSVMVYQMANMNKQVHVMENMSHDMHNMEKSTESSPEDCCLEQCQCFVSGCSTVAALPEIVKVNLIIELPAKILSSTIPAYSQQLASLYRPPIFS